MLYSFRFPLYLGLLVLILIFAFSHSFSFANICIFCCVSSCRRLYASQGFEHVSTEKLGNDCELYNLRLNLDVVD